MGEFETSSDGSLLTFITTYECGACCSHCLMSCSPNRHERLTFDQMKSAIDRFHNEDKCGLVVFTGGECTRLGSDLFDAIAYANIKGIATRIVTNAEWATDDHAAKTMIQSFRESGLDELNISFDDFHAEWVPVENVARVWKAAKKQGFASVVLAAGSGPISKYTPEKAEELLGESIPSIRHSDRSLQQVPDPDADGTVYVISRSTIARIGRGRHIDEGYCDIEQVKSMPHVRCSDSNNQPVITPNYHVGLCCGLDPEGNAILDLGPFEAFRGMDEFRKVFIATAETLGPGFLVDLVRSELPDIGFGRSWYSSACEMCEDLSRSQAAMGVLMRNLDNIGKAVDAEKFVQSFLEAGLNEK